MEGERGTICGGDKREIQSTDKIERSSSDVAQLRTEFEIGPKGTRCEVACSLVINN